MTRVFYCLLFSNSVNNYTTPPPRQSPDFQTIFAAAKQDSLSLANKKSEKDSQIYLVGLLHLSCPYLTPYLFVKNGYAIMNNSASTANFLKTA